MKGTGLAGDATDSEITAITLEWDAIRVEGQGATVDGTSVTIMAAGAYRLSGILNDRQLRIDTQDEETVNVERYPHVQSFEKTRFLMGYGPQRGCQSA